MVAGAKNCCWGQRLLRDLCPFLERLIASDGGSLHRHANRDVSRQTDQSLGAGFRELLLREVDCVKSRSRQAA
jgi:hypothetical protein